LLGGLLAALAVWDAGAGALPGISSDTWDVALTAAVLIPATFGVVWLLLPLATTRAAGPLAVLVGLLALGAWLVGAGALFNVTKLSALTLAGFWFLSLFEALSWIVLVACVIPLVDALSVYRGPTKVVVEQKPGLFEQISIGFRLPGEESGARLGPPDVLFFALFLAGAQRFGLRTGWTWIAMTGALGLTLLATYVFDLAGLPALPAIAIGFLAPNLDLVWSAVRASLRKPARP
jgi:hypothetical protein